MKIKTPVRAITQSDYCYRLIVVDDTNKKITYNKYYDRDEERANQVYKSILDINIRMNHDTGSELYTYLLKGRTPGETIDELNNIKEKFEIYE